MANTTSADERPGLDPVARLSQLGNRTNLMVIDATLRALPKTDAGYDVAAEELRILARRMVQATRDFDASMQPQLTA